MQRYALQRVLLTIPTIVLISVITFVGLRVAMPADVIDVILGQYGSDEAFRLQLEEELGLSASIPEQYARWVGIAWFWGDERGVLQGNLGESLHSGQPIVDELKTRVLVSLEVGLWGQAVGIVFAVPLGVWAALKQDQWPDYGLRSLAIFLNALPGFWIAVLIITFGSLWLNWAPPIVFKQVYENPVEHFKIMLLPALLVGLTPSGFLIRLTRTQMLEVLREDYVRTAYAKGLSQQVVLYKHALRNALIPIVTVVGVNLSTIIAGTVIFEQIFGLPGMGRYLVQGLENLDYTVIQGLVLIYSVILLVTVILVDLSYAWLDPRIRFQ